MTAYDDLMAFQRETEALAQISGRLGWDQETIMPKGAAAQRSEESAAIHSVLHARRSDPRVAEWLAAAEAGDLNAVQKAQLYHIRRSYERASRVPERLASALARLTSMAIGTWAEARAAGDMAGFVPTLAEIVDLKREEGQALAQGGDAYDALLDDYEPGATAASLSRMFGEMRPRLVALRGAALEAAPAPTLSGEFDEALQMELATELAQVFGYDLNRGRIDKSVHPFSSGSGNDVRITTRMRADAPLENVYSVIHETGHAIYEQNISQDYLLTPLGQGVSLGVHESQSRICENQLGRSEAFCSWLQGRIEARFGATGLSPRDFYRAVNAVHRGFIRTEADELQYNLHVMLRFDLERAMIAGDLQVADLEAAWNERFEADFGYAVPGPAKGCLQDVHWSVGLFGYFPTYSVGNLYAGCLFEAMQAARPALQEELAAGDLSGATAWLRENVQTHGGLYQPRELIAKATGAEPSAAPLLTYLERKFRDLYALPAS